MNKQCICPVCGTVAEIRRQRNGKNLRYLHCKHGHGGLQTRNRADEWEKLEREPFGILGELPPEAKSEHVEPVKNEVEITPVSVDEWQPDDDTAPEKDKAPVVLPESVQKASETAPKTNTVLKTIGFVFAGLGLGGLAINFAKQRG